MKTIVVTGSRGLLGSAIVRQIKLGEEYAVVRHTREDCDLNNLNDTINYISRLKQDYGLDTIIHCAAEVGGVLKNTQKTEAMFINNLLINDNIIRAAHANEIKNFVNVLSTCIFPDNANYPLTVDQIYNGDPHSSAFGYALAKRLSFQTVQSYHKVLKLNWVNVVPTNIYGINDNFNLETSHVISALIRKGYDAKQSGDDFTIWGSGEIFRQFIFSDDLAKLVLWAGENWATTPFHNDPFMAVNPVEYTIKELAYIIAAKFGIDENKIKFDTSKPSGIHRMTATSSMPDFEFTPLADGLNQTIEWYKSNITKIRI